MDCYTVLLEIFNLLPKWTLGNYGFLSSSTNNFSNDPLAIYLGDQNSIICILHLFPGLDPSIWFFLKLLTHGGAYGKKNLPHFLSAFAFVELTFFCTKKLLCCQRPHRIHTVVISFTISDNSLLGEPDVTNWPGLQNLHTSLKMPRPLHVHLSVQVHRSLLGVFSSYPEKEKKTCLKASLIFLRMSLYFLVRNSLGPPTTWYDEAMGGLLLFP